MPSDFRWHSFLVSAGYLPDTVKYQINDLFGELIKRNVEIRVVDNLWDIAEEVKTSTLNWSLCRMAYAKPRK